MFIVHVLKKQHWLSFVLKFFQKFKLYAMELTSINISGILQPVKR